MDATQLKQVVADHKKWLSGDGGRRADLIRADLTDADLTDADLTDADLSGADLTDADLTDADLIRADLTDADLTGADLRRADLSGANLKGANLIRADLSGSKGLLSPSQYITKHFKTTQDGIIVYKAVGLYRNAPATWKLKPKSVLTEVCNFVPTDTCGCGINVATLKWVKAETDSRAIWKCLIRWKWMAGVCVPYNTDGKIRCEKLELVEIVRKAQGE